MGLPFKAFQQPEPHKLIIPEPGVYNIGKYLLTYLPTCTIS